MLIHNTLIHQTATMSNYEVAESLHLKALNIEALRKNHSKQNRQISITVNEICQDGPTCSI